MASRADLAADGAFEEFDALVRTIAAGGAVDRGAAMRWSACRDLLLEGGGYREVLPGFVLQCGSVFKYREFITLYDPTPAKRLSFVETAMAAARLRHADRAAMTFAPEPPPRRAAADWTF